MKRSILTIEDSKPLSYLLTTILNKYNVKTVDNGYQAMKLFVSDFATDLILLNIPSADSDNIELLDHIATSSLLKDIPVIVLSNNNDEALKTTVLQLGATEFYSKPFDPIVLTEKVNQLLESNIPEVVQKKRSVFNLNIF